MSEQIEGPTYYLVFVSSIHMGVYTMYWNTNPRVAYGDRFFICTRLEGNKWN